MSGVIVTITILTYVQIYRRLDEIGFVSNDYIEHFIDTPFHTSPHLIHDA